MSVVHRITGYDKLTEMLALQFDLSDADFVRLQTYTAFYGSCKDTLGAIEIASKAAPEISYFCKIPLDEASRYDWFIEPFESEAVLAAKS